MRLHNFAYLFKQGTKSIFSNKLMSFACIGVLVACLLLIGGAVLFTLNVNSMVGVIVDRNEFFVFLKDGMSTVDLDVYDAQLDSIGNIASKRFISKEEAFQKEKEKFGEDAYLLEGIDADTYPNAYELKVKDIALLEDTIKRIEGMDGTEKVNSATEVSKMLVSMRQVVAYAGAGVVLILIVVSVLIITNTIKLTVFSRRREINIMKYVGATDNFIRMPFLIEGMMIGVIAAVAAFLILGVGYTYLLKYLEENFGNYIGVFASHSVSFGSVAVELFVGFAALGVFIGVVGSGVFVRKHLKV